MKGDNPDNRFKNYLRLSKLRIMIPVSLTGFTGYFLFSPEISPGILLSSLGILMVAISASVLNQIQETDLDAKMNRTMDRPLPARYLTIRSAFLYFVFCFITGIILLYLAGNLQAALLAFFAVIWYNGVYTGLKRITAFAVIPGAITGALPPLIGWVAAGGGILDRTVLFLSILFFVGQIPHFWLLVLRYDEEYKKAGIPRLTGQLPRNKVNLLIFTMVIISTLAALSLCYFEIIRTLYLKVILILASLALIWQLSGLFSVKTTQHVPGKYSRLLDLYFALILLLLISDRLIY